MTYSHVLFEHNHKDFIIIVEAENADTLITANIEAVVKEIAEAEKIEPKKYFIIYQENTGQWYGWDATTGMFAFLMGEDYKEAIASYLQLKIKKDKYKI